MTIMALHQTKLFLRSRTRQALSVVAFDAICSAQTRVSFPRRFPDRGRVEGTLYSTALTSQRCNNLSHGIYRFRNPPALLRDVLSFARCHCIVALKPLDCCLPGQLWPAHSTSIRMSRILLLSHPAEEHWQPAGCRGAVGANPCQPSS